MAENEERRAPAPPVTRLLPGQQPPGEDLSRILALTDGVFAFSLTLLVLSLTVPILDPTLPPAVLSGRLGAALRGDYPAFLGYVFAFAMIAIWWVSHHRLFRWIVRYDDVLIGLNLVLLLEIAVMPFVLRVYILYSNTLYAVILFALIQIASGLTLSLLWLYVSWNHRLIVRTIPKADIRWTQYRTFLTPAIFAVSIGVAFIDVSAAEFVWVGALVAQRFTWYSQWIRTVHQATPPAVR